jgi:response regulator RpfG family c-di-GMP phosphodiesterase
LKIIKRMKNHVPNIVIILIDGHGNRDVIARVFSYGIQDAFRRPYNRVLMVERVDGTAELYILSLGIE